MLGNIIREMRPTQWTKNVLLFVGLIFSKNLFEPELIEKAVLGFLSFCCFSSVVYIVNDVVDRESDRHHPVKCKRPIASGALPVSVAVTVAIVLTAAGTALAFYLGRQFAIVALLYLVLLVLYSFVLKRVVIVDVLILASGFVLRTIAGVEAIGVTISSWLLTCTIFLALFLGLSKRRHELVLLGDKSTEHRKILAEYSPELLDQMIAVATASALISYTLYTVDADTIAKFGTSNLIYTVPFVIFGIFRYLYLIHEKQEGGRPDKLLLSDRPILVNNVLWLIAAAAIIYIG
jgi:4-hydroxybenzoate polyprenyltransferase